MDKIKALLEKSGCSTEVAAKICESLVNYKKSLREQFDAEYSAKIGQAKKICLEETNSYKRELARRLQVYLETKKVGIDKHLAKKSALNESEASTKLRNIRGLLEGVQYDSKPNGNVAALEKAKKQVQVANEQRDVAIEKANRHMAIAEKALKQNRKLTTENSSLKKISESAPPKRARQPQRIDSGRNGGRPSTTRPALLESQTRRTAPKKGPSLKTDKFGIEAIAEQLDSELI